MPTRHPWFRRRVPRCPSGPLVGGQWNQSSSGEQDGLKPYYLLCHASERSLNPETIIGLNSESKVSKWYPQTWDCNKSMADTPLNMWFPPATVTCDAASDYLRIAWATQMRTSEVLGVESSQSFPAGAGCSSISLRWKCCPICWNKGCQPHMAFDQLLILHGLHRIRVCYHKAHRQFQQNSVSWWTLASSLEAATWAFASTS